MTATIVVISTITIGVVLSHCIVHVVVIIIIIIIIVYNVAIAVLQERLKITPVIGPCKTGSSEKVRGRHDQPQEHGVNP